LDGLFFGARARRRARIKRYFAWAGAVSLVAILLGVPGSNAGLSFIERVIGDAPGVVAGESVQADRDGTGLLGVRGKARAATPAERAATSAPIPAPSPLPSGASVEEIILDAAAEYGISGDYLLSVAQCESGYDPGAYNAAGYHGLFQFDFQTWGAYGYGSIYDPVAQARTAAKLFAAGESFRWPNCS
jgi:hypothetical protein